MNLQRRLTLGTKTNMDDELYDKTTGYDDETGIKFAKGLTQDERKQATILYRLFNELWGVCIVVGDPGTGKDLFGNYLSYKLKKFFPHKRVLRDEKPRRLYGEYAGIFNDQVIQDDLAKMRMIAKGVGATRYDEVLEKAADDWVKGAGKVMLKNSILYLTEYYRYCYNREPHNPMNKTMGAIQKVKRHLDCLVIGTTQLESELDRKTSKPWVDWRVTCTRSIKNPTGFVYFIQKVKYDRHRDHFELVRQPFPLPFDAGRPRSDLGDGKIKLVKPHYRPENEEERVVLEVLKSGVDNYEKLVEVLETDGDMNEEEISVTVKELGLRLEGKRPKFVISYPCYFKLWNSKSAPQLTSGLKVEG